MLLEDLARVVATVERRRHALDTAVEPTRAICSLLLAWGFARTGNAARAHQLRSEAARRLQGNEVHLLACAILRSRIDDVLDGRPFPSAPPEGRIAHLLPHFREEQERGRAKFDTYKLERLRQSSRIMEPDPISTGEILDLFHANRLALFLSKPSVVEPLTPDELGQLEAFRTSGDHRSLELFRRASLTQELDLDSYVPTWERVTDRFNTNSHYCVSAVAFVDILVYALCRPR